MLLGLSKHKDNNLLKGGQISKFGEHFFSLLRGFAFVYYTQHVFGEKSDVILHVAMELINAHVKGSSLVRDNCGFLEGLFPTFLWFLVTGPGSGRYTRERICNHGKGAV